MHPQASDTVGVWPLHTNSLAWGSPKATQFSLTVQSGHPALKHGGAWV